MGTRNRGALLRSGSRLRELIRDADFPPTAFLKLSLPEQVVAVPSADSRFAMEAAIPMVVSEVAGVSATISGFASEAANEATGVSSTPYLTVTPAWGNTIPAGGTVEVPFRLGLASAGTYRARVTIGGWDGRARTFADQRVPNACHRSSGAARDTEQMRA